MNDFRRGRDRIAGVEQFLAGLRRCGDEPQRRRLVAADLAILARLELGRGNVIPHREQLGRLAEVVAGFQRSHIDLGDLGLVPLLAEVLVEEVDRGFDPAIVEPIDDAQGVHVSAAIDVLRAYTHVGERFASETAHRHLEDLIPAVQLVVFKRVVAVFVPALAEVDLGELVLVDDDDSARLDVADVGLEPGGIHRHQGVDRIAGGVDIGAGELHLKAGYAVSRASGSADLSRKIREGGDIVTEERRRVGELAAGELHAVAGVAAEADGHSAKRFGSYAPVGGRGVRGHQLHNLSKRRIKPKDCSPPQGRQATHTRVNPSPSRARPRSYQLPSLQGADQLQHRLLAVAEHHQTVVGGEQRVGDAGEPGAEATLDHHHGLGLVHVYDRHPGDGA